MNDRALALLVEFHAGVCKLAAAALLVVAAQQVVAGSYPLLYASLVVGAVLSAAAAVLPWIAPRTRLVIMRRLVWGACGLSLAGAVGGMLVAHAGVWLAAQLLLVAAVMTELGPRRHVLRWLWFATIPIAVTIALYYALAPVRPMPD